MGIPPRCGHLHPLMKVREAFRQIFFELGYVDVMVVVVVAIGVVRECD